MKNEEPRIKSFSKNITKDQRQLHDFNKKPEYVSKCCNAGFYTNFGDEGTNFYCCNACGKPTDLIAMPVKRVLNKKRPTGKNFFDYPLSEKKKIINAAAKNATKMQLLTITNSDKISSKQSNTDTTHIVNEKLSMQKTSKVCEPRQFNWESQYPLNTLTGKTKQEFIDFIQFLLDKQREETIDYISQNQGWEESEDIYRKHYKLKPKYTK